ncbi:hypothetical protein TSAR_006716 [Trichomalopsis sarcophagae]|uniref:Uncharacterized protein n=1 Tax=Trichomalopsis sarcophagae TaxID=543379 RepID=A0A232EN76_9HYME|nr:hypothetical protein TSAR_006716 [Trichomalopsis sarcophagae]
MANHINGKDQVRDKFKDAMVLWAALKEQRKRKNEELNYLAEGRKGPENKRDKPYRQNEHAAIIQITCENSAAMRTAADDEWDTINYKDQWDHRDINGETLIFQAVRAGSSGSVYFLLKKGIDKLTVNKKGDDVYCEAINTGREDILRALMSHEVNPVTKKYLYTPAINKKENQLIPLLKIKGIRPTDPVAALLLAIREGSLERMRELYTNKPTGGPLGFLHEAVLQGSNIKVIEHLIESSHDIEARTGNGRTSLQIAIAAKHHQITRYLIEKGANVRA